MSSKSSTHKRNKYGILALLLVLTLASCGRQPSARVPAVYVDLDCLVRLHPSHGALLLAPMPPQATGSRATSVDEPVRAFTGDRDAPVSTTQRRDARADQRLNLIRARLESRERQALNREVAQLRSESNALLADQTLANRAVWLSEALQVIDEFRGRLAEADLSALAARLTADAMPAAQAAKTALDASLAGRREVRTAFTRRLAEVDTAYFRRQEEARADAMARRDARIDAVRNASAYRMERLLRRVDTVTGWTGDGRQSFGSREFNASVNAVAPAVSNRSIGCTVAGEQPLLAQQQAARAVCREWVMTYCRLHGKRAEFTRKRQPDWTQRVARDMEAMLP